MDNPNPDMDSSYLPIDDLKAIVTKYQTRKVLCEDVDFVEQKGSSDWLLNGLKTNEKMGISSDTINERVTKYGKNEKDAVKLKSFCTLCCEALNDLTLIVMCVAGVANIIINLIMEEHKETAWIEGFAILLAVAIVVIVQAVNDMKKETEFQKLNEQAEQGKQIEIVRDGKEIYHSNSKVLVGDIVKVRGGMEIAGDGILLQGYNVQVDESSMTGETEPIHKASISECIKKRDEIQASGKTNEESIHSVPTPVMISGTKILGGQGYMLVILVGSHSSIGKIQDLVDGETDPTPLQLKLEKIARDIGIFGLISAILLFTALLIRFLIENSINGWDQKKSIVHIKKVLDHFLIAITILIVAIPEGLPLAVTLSLAFSVQKMMEQNNLVRRLQACETMGGANIICSDKTGTLTQNKMFLTHFWNGAVHHVYNEENSTHKEYHSFMHTDASKVFENVITLNSTEDPSKDQGNPTEQATLKYLDRLGFEVMKHRSSYKPEFVSSFSSNRKRMSTIIKMEDDRLFVFMKGASEWMLRVSDKFLNLQSGEVSNLDFELKGDIETAITSFAKQSLRTIGLVYKEISAEEMDLESVDEKGVYNFEKDGFTFVGICGIKDIIKPEVPDAVLRCHRAGIDVKMVTGDNLITAEAIAKDVNIISDRNKDTALIMEGTEFLKLIGGVICDHCKDKADCTCVKNKNELRLPENKGKKVRKDVIQNGAEFDKIWKNLAVLARSRPEDKYALVVGLRERGNVVAVTGDGTNDAPALSKADVGFAMNIAGTEVAKQAADILLLDDNFKSIVTAAKWGRNIYDSIQKFLQFQLTVNVVAVTTTFVSALYLQEAILSPVQMLWINLIMDTLAALALATEPPKEELLDRAPIKKDDYIVTPLMIKHILGQSVFQTILLLIIVFTGESFLFELHREKQMMPNSKLIIPGREVDGYDKNNYDGNYSIHFTYIFNIFVMLQFFNFLNCRMIRDEINVFKGICKSTFLLVILLIIFILQIIFLTFCGGAIRVHQWGLGPVQWILCIVIGLVGLPIRYILVCIPFQKCCIKGVGNKEININSLNAKSSVSIKKSHTRQFYQRQPTVSKKSSSVLP